MQHPSATHVADDLVVAVFVHPDDETGLKPGVVDDPEPAEACIVLLIQRDARMDSAQLEWPV